MIHQPYYILQGIALSGLSIYFYMNNFNYWAIGFSVLLAIGSFGISTEDPKNKKDEKIKNSVNSKTYHFFDKFSKINGIDWIISLIKYPILIA